MSARMSSVGANFAVVETNPMDAVSPRTLAATFVPSSCRALDSASPFLVAVPSLSIDAVRLPTPRRSAGSNWAAPPRKVMLNETSGRSVFSETIRLGAVRQR